MAGIAGSHPKDLAPTNPVQSLAESVTPVINPMPSPQGLQAPAPTPMAAPSDSQPLQMPAQAPQADPLDAILDQHLGPQGGRQAQDPLDAILDQHLGPNNPEAEANANPEQSADFGTRAKVGMESSEADKETTLRKIYGDDNVKKDSKGGFLVKEDGKFKHFNTDVMGIGDPANLVRQGIVEVGALPAEIGAGVASAGEALTGVGAPAAVPTMAVGRAVGGASGELLARGVNNMMGGVQHGLVDDAVSAATQGGMRALFGHLFDALPGAYGKLTGKEAQSAAGEAVARTVAPLNQAAEQGIAASTATHEAAGAEGRLSQAVKDATNLQAQSKKLGLDLTPSELAPGDAQARALVEKADKTPAMQAWRENRAKQMNALVDQFQNTVAKGDPEKLPTLISDASVIDHDLGAKIGGFRKQAIAESGDQLINATGTSEFSGASNLKSGLVEASKKLGFVDPDSGALKYSFRDRPANSEIAQQLGMDESKVSWLSKFLVDTNDKLTNGKGQIQLKEANQMYSQLSRQVDNAFDGQNNIRPQYSRDYVGALIDLKNGVRDTMTEGIGTTLGKDQQAAYKTALGDFRTNKGALEDMSGLLRRASSDPSSNPTAQYVMDYITKSPADAPARIQAYKTIFGDTHPEAIEALKAAHFRQILNENAYSESDLASKQISGNFKAEGFLNKMKPGSAKREIFESLYGKPQTESFMNLAKVMGAIQNESTTKTTDPSSLLKRVFVGGYDFIKGDPQAAIELFSKDRATRNIISGASNEKLMRGLSTQKQALLSKIVAGVKNGATPQTKLGNTASGLAAQQATGMIKNNQGGTE